MKTVPPPAAWPMRRLRDFWDYLPAFRAVAEAGTLPAAAAVLAISPPALSRSIRLLEDALGYALFERRARRLHLTASGQALLDAVRASMRRIDDATAGTGPEPAPPLRVATSADAAWLVPRLAAAVSPSPLRHVPLPRDLAPALLRGEVDLAVVAEHRLEAGLQTIALGTVRWRLFHARRAGAATTGAELPMATAPGDPWPVHRHRLVVAELGALTDLPSAVASGQLAAFLPEAVAVGLRSDPAVAALGRPLFALRRPGLDGPPERASAAVSAALEALAELIADTAPGRLGRRSGKQHVDRN